MSGDCDYGDMGSRFSYDESTLDAVLRGAVDDTASADICGFVEEVRRAATGEVTPTRELVAMFEGDFSTQLTSSAERPAPSKTSRSRRMLQTALSKIAALGLGAKVGLGTAVAAAAVAGGGAAGTLPTPMQNAVARAVEATTPFEFPSQADDSSAFGERVSTDAVDGGVDGPTIAEEASQGRAGGDASADGRVKAAAAKAKAAGKSLAGHARAAAAKATAQERRRAAGGPPEQAPPADVPRGKPDEHADDGLQRAAEAREDRPVDPPQPDTLPQDPSSLRSGSSDASSSGQQQAEDASATGDEASTARSGNADRSRRP